MLNNKYLLECQKWFLHCTDILDWSEHSESVAKLGSFLSNLQLKNTDDHFMCDRVLMEALYIMCNLDDFHPIFRYLRLPEKLKKYVIYLSIKIIFVSHICVTNTLY